MPHVSICIPAYNAAATIGETIQSVLDSTYTDFEIVVSDDASTDGTRQVVEAIADERIRFFPHRDNVGAPANWNRALSYARGDVIGLLNHDDLYGPFWLAFAVHALRKYLHVGWVATAFRVVNAENKTLVVEQRFARSGEIGRAEVFVRLAQLNGLGPVYLARRQALAEVGGYDESLGFGADNDLFLRLAARYPLYYSCNPQHAAWRLHQGNLTHRWSLIAQITEGLAILDKAFRDPALPDELRCQQAACMAYYYYKILCGIREHLEAGKIEAAQDILNVFKTHLLELGRRSSPP